MSKQQQSVIKKSKAKKNNQDNYATSNHKIEEVSEEEPEEEIEIAEQKRNKTKENTEKKEKPTEINTSIKQVEQLEEKNQTVAAVAKKVDEGEEEEYEEEEEENYDEKDDDIIDFGELANNEQFETIHQTEDGGVLHTQDLYHPETITNHNIENLATESQPNQVLHKIDSNCSDDNKYDNFSSGGNFSDSDPKENYSQHDVAKTIFTKIAEDIFPKMLSKNLDNKKRTAYDLLTNDAYLNRFFEKSETEVNARMIKNFFARNEEYALKKNIKLRERLENMANEADFQLKKEKKRLVPPGQARKSDDYYKDQLLFLKMKELKLEDKKRRLEEMDNKNNTYKPTLSEYAVKLKEKEKKEKEENKELGGHGGSIHERLFKNPTKESKRTKKGIQTSAAQDIPIKKEETKKENAEKVRNIVDKLFNDAADRKSRILNETQIDTILMKPESLVTNESKQVILEKIVKDFEINVVDVLKKKMGDNINFDEHCKILFGLGFIHYPSFEEINDKDKRQRNESKLSHESWIFLTKNNESVQLLDTWKVLVFCFTIMGVYDGEGPANDVSFMSRSGYKKGTGCSNFGGFANLLSDDQLMRIDEDEHHISEEDDESDDDKVRDNVKRGTRVKKKTTVKNRSIDVGIDHTIAVAERIIITEVEKENVEEEGEININANNQEDKIKSDKALIQSENKVNQSNVKDGELDKEPLDVPKEQEVDKNIDTSKPKNSLVEGLEEIGNLVSSDNLSIDLKKEDGSGKTMNLNLAQVEKDTNAKVSKNSLEKNETEIEIGKNFEDLKRKSISNFMPENSNKETKRDSIKKKSSVVSPEISRKASNDHCHSRGSSPPGSPTAHRKSSPPGSIKKFAPKRKESPDFAEIFKKMDTKDLSSPIETKPKESDLNISSIEKPRGTSKKESSFIKNASFRSNTNISFDKSIISSKKTNNDIFRIVCPNLNMGIYNYSRRMVKHIKLVFRQFYDNRVAYLSELKKQLQMEKKKINEKSTDKIVKLSSAMDKSVDYYKNKALEKLKEYCEQTGKEAKLENVWEIQREKRLSKYSQVKKELDDKIMKECTFKPKVYPYHVQNKDDDAVEKNVVKKLYQEGVNKAKKMQEYKTPDWEYEKSKIDCTFQPKIGSVDYSVFSDSQYMEGESVKKSVERMQRARIERKLCDLQLKRGIINIKDFNNVSDLFKDDGSKPMSYWIDNLCNIVTFDNIKSEEERQKLKQEKIKEIKKQFHFRSMSQVPIIQLDVSLSEKKTARLLVFENDDPDELADSFCDKYKLSDDKRIFLKDLILEKIMSYQNKKASL